MDFHWFAFNDESYENDELDQARCFESKERFLASIDPVKLGVTFDKIEDEAKAKPKPKAKPKAKAKAKAKLSSKPEPDNREQK